MSNPIPSWVLDEGWAPTCSFLLFPGSMRYVEPPEFCANEPRPGTDLCSIHTHYTVEPGRLSFQECYESGWEPCDEYED